MGALPSNIGYCTVVGKFISFVADGDDVDRFPDAVPLTDLTIRFKPSVSTVTDQTATPPVTILTSEIVCTTDAEGVLLGPDGLPNVLLVASDDPDLKPTGWTWNVAISSPSMRTLTFDFVAPVGGTVDLATTVPVPSSPGTQVSAWQAAVTATITARDQVLAARTEVLAAIEDFDPGAGGAGLDVEAVRDAIGATLVGGAGITVNVDDVGNTVTIARTNASKTEVGLGNVDNTSDASKPVSNAQQAALDLKAPLSALGSAAGQSSSAFATAAQGAKADSAVQPAALAGKADLVDGVVPLAQLPAAVSVMVAVAEWNGTSWPARPDAILVIWSSLAYDNTVPAPPQMTSHDIWLADKDTVVAA